jgi:beta-galactosidase
MHRSLYDLNVPCESVFPETKDFSAYKLLIVPMLYVANNALLRKISDYVNSGGHALMTFNSGFALENSAARTVRAPGPLRDAAGFSYQEFSNIEELIALKRDPFHVGAANAVQHWAEFLVPDHAEPLAC